MSGKTLDIKGKIACGKAEILSFNEYADALEWVCGQSLSSDTVIVNGDGMRLNAVLRRHGMPQQSARVKNSNPNIKSCIL